MISLAFSDILIIVLFFLAVLFIGLKQKLKQKDSTEDFFLSERKVGLFLFILTNVSTWYGGILGIGEFTYRYGLLSWFTQGLPYYIFALIFAFVLAPKIRKASLFTIPDKIEEAYGKKTALSSAVIIYILVLPAAYMLMIAAIISLIFKIALPLSLFITFGVSSVYLFKSGYRSDLYTDAFEFFVMFAGFSILFIASGSNFGGYNYLQATLPHEFLSLTGGASITYISVWFFIALWTFGDPGFHQRCYAAKSPNVAKLGIIISVLLWAVFDFLTTATGLYARAALPDVENPLYAFPMLAEQILGPGLKGIFYSALFATILSTLNSNLFLSGTTIGRDFYFRMNPSAPESKIIFYTRLGILFSGVISIFLAWYFQSVVAIWYTIGSICIPGIILLIIGAYNERLRVNENFALAEIFLGAGAALVWFIIRSQFDAETLFYEIEPMLVGLFIASAVHFTGVIAHRRY